MLEDLSVEIGIHYHGGVSENALVDVYDYSRAIYGLSRTAAIVSEYYKTGKVIARAPSSTIDFYIRAAEEGSFKQALAAAAFGGIVSTPFAIFFTRLTDHWLPAPDYTQEMILAEERRTNDLLEQLLEGRVAEPSEDTEEPDELSFFLEEREAELNVLRSILSSSFAQIFRPVARGGTEYASLFGATDGQPAPPAKLVTPTTVGLIESEMLDEEIRTINAKVTGFTRGSKTGLCFSQRLGQGFRFEYRGEEDRLPTRDIFSWSQYEQEEIIMEGQFVRYFDGEIKKFIVYFAQRAVSHTGTE